MVDSAQAQDVSNYQGHYDWAKAKADIPRLVLGIARVTQGLGGPAVNSPDPDAAWNWQQLEANGLDKGAYHFGSPGKGQPKAQADYFVNECAKLPGGITPRTELWLDHESNDGIAPAAAAQWAVEFMLELDKLVPHNPHGVYTFINFAKEGNCAGLEDYYLWLAYPASTAPAEPLPWMGPQFVLWQWGNRDGTDADAFMGTVDQYNLWVDRFKPQHPNVMHWIAWHHTTFEYAATKHGTTPEKMVQAAHDAHHTYRPEVADIIHRQAWKEQLPIGVWLYKYV